MAYERNNWGGRDDRSSGRDRGDYGRSQSRGGYGGGDRYGRGDDDRGFFDRAGDEVRSWFGDEDAERRRDADARRYEREHGYGQGRDNDDRWRGDYGRNTAGGWGNQRGWNDDRFSSRSNSYRDYEDRGRGYPGAGESGFGYDTDDMAGNRRFDRIDAGSTGTHGAHPMSAPAGTSYGGYSSNYARDAAILRQSQGGGRSQRMGQGSSDHDPHYAQWRNQQIESLDRDYDDYRREHQSKFEQEFGTWRTKRQGQRQALGNVTEHMEVVGSDGQHVGKVDHVRGDRILLAKNDENANGRHHSIPCSWIDSVDSQVKLSKTAEEALRAWRDEERSRALFEREDQGSDGPHALNRSFSGTYNNDR